MPRHRHLSLRFKLLCLLLVLCMAALVSCDSAGLDLDPKYQGAVRSAAEPAPIKQFDSSTSLNVHKSLAEQYPADPSISDALKVFSERTVSEVLKGNEGNAVFSPVSLYMALALAGAGAAGETEREILALLGLEGKDRDEIAKGMQAMVFRLNYSDDNNVMQLTNSLWLSDSMDFRKDYLRSASQNYSAALFTADFSDPLAAEAMNRWIDDQTENLPKSSLDTNQDTVMHILSSIRFYGTWLNKINPYTIVKDEFYCEDGTIGSASYMSCEIADHGYWMGDGFTASYLEF